MTTTGKKSKITSSLKYTPYEKNNSPKRFCKEKNPPSNKNQQKWQSSQEIDPLAIYTWAVWRICLYARSNVKFIVSNQHTYFFLNEFEWTMSENLPHWLFSANTNSLPNCSHMLMSHISFDSYVSCLLLCSCVCVCITNVCRDCSAFSRRFFCRSPQFCLASRQFILCNVLNGLETEHKWRQALESKTTRCMPILEREKNRWEYIDFIAKNYSGRLFRTILLWSRQ